ncbi:CidA/LrgA family protein [Brucella gallinifaecis]|uniref:CidA/LrgA family protein n=1 Tax=Brucella gallinifaecis TaxID=215590 RepID=UPI0023604920|nr:CidA/LrgA family protein [Brucella gallinifaecis]
MDKLLSFVPGFISIVVSWWIGTFLVLQFHLPVPGAVFGLLVLLLGFGVFQNLFAAVLPTGSVLLQNFPLFLYPSGAGFLVLSGISLGGFIKIIITIAVSLLVSLMLCAHVFKWLRRSGN